MGLYHNDDWKSLLLKGKLIILIAHKIQRVSSEDWKRENYGLPQQNSISNAQSNG